MIQNPHRWMFVLILALVFIVPLSVSAQNKVVVIPLMESCLPAPVPKTGQATSYRTGDDGTHQAGIASPSPRFVDHGNGTVTDKLTGLIWLKNGDCTKFHGLDYSTQNTRPWDQAINDCNWLNTNHCGLTDGSSSGDWRLPNVKELLSLLYYANSGSGKKLPPGCPLDASTRFGYWSATTNIGGFAWYVDLFYGNHKGDNLKSELYYVRCVR